MEKVDDALGIGGDPRREMAVFLIECEAVSVALKALPDSNFRFLTSKEH
jgi:hypothetical protein